MQLWHLRCEPDGSAGWRGHAIPEGGLALGVDASGALALGEEAPREGGAVAHLVPLTLRGSRELALVVAPDARGLRVGGLPPLPVALLDDRAEIAVGGATLYLTRSAPAAVESFEPVGESARCLRCTRVLRAGDRVLRCGECGGLHHEGERAAAAGELRCASYDERCAGCRQAWRALEWTPAERLE